MRLPVLLGSVLVALACTPVPAPDRPSDPAELAPSPPPAELTSSSPPVARSSTMPDTAALVRLAAADSSWGSSGVVPIDAPPPYWVVAIVDLHPEQAIATLHLTELELFDAEGRSLGRADRELTLHVVPPDATPFSPATADTPLPSPITPDHSLRLRVRGRMVDAFAERIAMAPPVTYRATFHTDTGAVVHVTAPLGSPWPTA